MKFKSSSNHMTISCPSCPKTSVFSAYAVAKYLTAVRPGVLTQSGPSNHSLEPNRMKRLQIIQLT